MSASLLDSACDAHASIAISSPIKGLALIPDPKLDFTKDSDIAKPLVEDSASHSPFEPSASIDIPSEALISKLLESLEALETQDSRKNSETTSPSPLTASTGGSADPIPSSPTDIYNDFSSPVGPLTREHSTDSLAAAVQHLSLANSQQRRPAALAALQSAPRPTLPSFGNLVSTTTTTAQASNTTWTAPAPVITPATTAAAAAAVAAVATSGGPATPLQMPSFQIPQTQQAQHAGLFSTSTAAAAGLNLGAANLTTAAHAYPTNSNLTFPVLAAAPTTGGAAVAPSQLAVYQAVYSDRLARAQAQMQLFSMFSPPPSPVYEECLVGVDGAYQSYCRQIINNEINVAALRMLSHVKAAQLTDPPAVTRLIGKRYFCSLKEVSKVVAASRMLLIAPDVRPSVTAHIKPVRLLQMVMAAADAAGVPYVFCLSRRGIGQVFGRDKSMSIVAVMHVDGVENEYLTLLEQAAQGRELYAMHRGGLNNNNINTTTIDNKIGVGFGIGGYHTPNMNYYGHQRQHQQQCYDSYLPSPAQPQFNYTTHGGGYQGSIY